MSKQVLGQKLFQDGLVKRLDKKEHFLVGENEYTVRRENDDKYFYDWYCTCMAWKMDSAERHCKHCIAVVLFIKNEKKKFPTEDDD